MAHVCNYIIRQDKPENIVWEIRPVTRKHLVDPYSDWNCSATANEFKMRQNFDKTLGKSKRRFLQVCYRDAVSCPKFLWYHLREEKSVPTRLSLH